MFTKNPKKIITTSVTVDVARGLGNDYSAFIVFDITEFPYKVVAKYRNNEIKPMMFPSIINDVGKGYNNAWILVEVNDIGDQVANILHYDLEYDNILMASKEDVLVKSLDLALVERNLNLVLEQLLLLKN